MVEGVEAFEAELEAAVTLEREDAPEAWSANLFTLVSDMFPRRTVASVVGIGACGGSIVMMFFGAIVGLILQMTHGNYLPVFLIAGTAYLIAIGVIQMLVPRLAPVKIGKDVAAESAVATV